MGLLRHAADKCPKFTPDTFYVPTVKKLFNEKHKLINITFF